MDRVAAHQPTLFELALYRRYYPVMGFLGRRRFSWRLAAPVLVGLALIVARACEEGDLVSRRLVGAPRAETVGSSESVERLFAAGRSSVFVEIEGTVSRILTDDLQGSRHQRFVVELSSGHTVLVAHNIDLAPRVPLGRGDRVEVRGEYEWNDRGGVVHWTHRDPQRRKTGGWIFHGGREYR